MALYPPVIYFSSQAAADSAVLNSSIGNASLAVSNNYVVGNTDPLFNTHCAIASDTSGNLYVADSNNHVIRKIVISTGVVSTLAGTWAGYTDGSGNVAQFNNPYDVALDTSGNLYVADTGNNRIRKIVISTGVVSTLAGTGSQGYADTGYYGNPATFRDPQGIAYDNAGNLYVADTGNHIIRKIVISTGEVTTLVGDPPNSGYVEGYGNLVRFSNPTGIALDNPGNIYVADISNHCIRKFAISTGQVTTLAGSSQGYAEGYGSYARFNHPTGIALDNSGNMYVADTYNHVIRKIEISSGAVTTFAGDQAISGYQNGVAGAVQFGSPNSIALDTSGNLYITDNTTWVIRKFFISTNTATDVAGVPYLSGYKDSIVLTATQWKVSTNSDSAQAGNSSYVWNNGTTLSPESGTYFLYPMPSGSVCFLQGTAVLCSVNGYDMYVPVEELTKDSLVKTLFNGYKKVELIGKEVMNNPGSDERIQNRLYKCTPDKYPELVTDLYITGCHSILVDTITDQQKDSLVENLGRIFVTDKKYRLIACVDERAEPWNSEGEYTVWHFALENDNIHMNYGVYVNGGLLVESCGIHVLKNKSNMVLL
ncbi:MAG: hypothetical protein EBU66_16025 [Bacteroidetes bacterium]|nr:hypothetical protein [Bacteroidota bacterium]